MAAVELPVLADPGAVAPRDGDTAPADLVALLMQQLHETQTELERVQLARLRAGAGATADVAFQDASVLGTHAEGPYRHLDIDFQGLRAGRIALARLSVRLVLHHGRPGLALFAAPDAAPPLRDWQPDGGEGGRAFVLWVPGDAGGRRRAARLGASDRLLFTAAARAVARVLHDPPHPLPALWAATAARLLHQLQGEPLRLRWDGLQLDAPDAPAPGLELRIERALLGADLLGDLRVRWTPRPAAGRPALRILRPAEPAAALLALWPTDADGTPAADLALPLGGSAGWRRRLADWFRLDARARVLCAGIAGAFAAAAAGHAQAAAAAALATEARRLDRAWSLRCALRGGPPQDGRA